MAEKIPAMLIAHADNIARLVNRGMIRNPGYSFV
jgi:hypothetical protein